MRLKSCFLACGRGSVLAHSLGLLFMPPAQNFVVLPGFSSLSDPRSKFLPLSIPVLVKTTTQLLSCQPYLLELANSYKENNYSILDCSFLAVLIVTHFLSDLEVLLCLQSYLLFLNTSSVQFSRSVMSNSLRPHESQHARLPCPSPTPGVYSDPCPSSR